MEALQAVALGQYPKSLTLEDGSSILARPLVRDDAAALLGFFSRIPAEDRYWLREDVTDRGVIERWIAELNYERVLPLLAIRDSEVVADATLHRRHFGARRLTGEVRMVVAPPFRRRGLAYLLLGELHDIAAAAGLESLEAEIVSGAQSAAREACELFGFREVGRIPNYLRGKDGAPHDLLTLVYRLDGTAPTAEPE